MRFNNCVAPHWDSNDVLVVEKEAFYVLDMPWHLLVNFPFKVSMYMTYCQ